MQKADVKFQDVEDEFAIESSGDWNHDTIGDLVDKILKTSKNIKNKTIFWDFKEVSHFDSAGIMLIIKATYNFEQSNNLVKIINLKSEHKKILNFYKKSFSPKAETIQKELGFLHRIGKSTIDYFNGFFKFLIFIGESNYFMFYAILNPLKFRFKATIKHIETSGIRAIPIIALTSFLIGIVIAYQASSQLVKFGANIFIVEMVGISIFRELAPLMTAIVIAGRSASSYTAEIGTMKITEEIDAMKTMGFHPQIFLVLPRTFALIIAMPLIVFFADIIGIMGGMLVANLSLDISFAEFLNRMQSQIPIRHLYIGLIKAPFFGIIIALIGAYRGFQVTTSTDSIGKYTTISVVNAIFWVIACDALFSVILTEIGM